MLLRMERKKTRSIGVEVVVSTVVPLSVLPSKNCFCKARKDGVRQVCDAVGIAFADEVRGRGWRGGGIEHPPIGSMHAHLVRLIYPQKREANDELEHGHAQNPAARLHDPIPRPPWVPSVARPS